MPDFDLSLLDSLPDAQFTPAGFASTYGRAARAASQATGIDANTLLGQWGLETGWGKSVIPGTNNLGNIKAFDGSGVAARDNQTESNDRYQQFATPEDFAASYADLINRKYKGALNTGVDANATAKALAAGGYAEDPNYVGKLIAATSTVAKARGLAPSEPAPGGDGLISSANAATFDMSAIDALPDMSGAAPSGGGGRQPYVPGVTDNPIPLPSQQPDSNFLTKLGAGVGEGFGNAVLGGQALVGSGLSALGANDAGDWLRADAQQGKRNLAQQADSAAGDSGWRTAGNIVGSTVPFLAATPELLPQIAAGGLYGASQGALNDTGILPGAVEGAGLGAVGATVAPAAGRLLGAGVAAARPAVSGLMNAIRGGESAATARIANALGGDLDGTIASLRNNSNEIIPGSLPTAAEAGQNTQLVGLQRALQNTEAGQIAFTDRMNANNAARWQSADAAVGPNLSSEADTFTRQQIARIAAGQSELQPLTQAQADVMQTPAYAQAIKSARNLAETRASGTFEDQQAPLLQNLRQRIDDVAGTPDTIDALKAARGRTADDLFGSTDASVPTSWPEYTALNEKPAFRQAMQVAQTMSDNLGEGPLLATEADGAGQWVSGRGLLYAKGVLDDQINRLLQQEQNAQARPIIAVRNQLVGLMDRASPDYAPARARFQADSAPIDAQQSLQTRLNGTVDPLTGAVSPNKLRQTINSVVGEQLKPGIRPADQVTPQMVEQLRALGQQARATPTNLVGLGGEGQEYMRQALQDRVRASSDSILKREANKAASDFDAYLANQSPSYGQYLSEAASTGADIQSRQQLQAALEKLGLGSHNTAGDPIMTLNGAKSLLAGQAPLTGGARAYANDLISDLTRASAANNPLGAAGSQTYANAQLGGGLLGRFIQGRTGDAAIIGTAAAGGVLPAAAGFIAQRAVARAAAKTERAAIDLLLDPKKLASALKEFSGTPSARDAFVDTLKQKASGAGKAGQRAVQVYEANHAQTKEKEGR